MVSKFEQVHVPGSAPETRSTIRHQFAVALPMLDSIKGRLEAFIDAIATVGLGVSLEYKIEDNRLSIIDRDTTNGPKILGRLLPK